MRQLLFVMSLLGALTAAAAEVPVWSGPGWYQRESSPGGFRLIAGPFETVDACQATLPGDEDLAEFTCEQYAEKPSGSEWWGADYPGT